MALTYELPTRPSRPFKRGDLVDTMNRDHSYMETVRVVRASSRSATTDCGRRWDQSGWWISETCAWPFPWIRHSRRKRTTSESSRPV